MVCADVAGELGVGRPGQDRRGRDPFVLERGDEAGEDRFGDERDGRAVVEAGEDGPLAGAFLAGGIEDFVDEITAVGFLELEDMGGDFDQVGIEFALVPLGEGLGELLVVQAEPGRHEAGRPRR